MKLLLTLFSCLFMIFQALSQTTFIKQLDNDNPNGSLRVMPTNDLGWVIYSKGETKLTKFNLCGDVDWRQSYDIPNATNSLNEITKTQDGGFAILTREQVGDTYGMAVTKLNPNGEIAWSKSYNNIGYEYYPYTISEDLLGNLILFGNITQLDDLSVFSHVTKLNNYGEILQSQTYNFGGFWGGAISTTDNGVLFRTGSNFIKLNSNLQVSWKTSIEAPTYHYNAPLEVFDGYIITANNQSNGIISYYKIDLNGNLLWGGRKNTNQSGIPNSLRLASQGRVVALFNSQIAGINYSTARIFNSEMELISEHTLDQADFIPRDICFLENSNPVLIGISGNNTSYARLLNNFENECSANSPEFSMNVEPISSNLGNVVVNDHNLFNADFNSSAATETINTVDLCTVEKILDLGEDTILCEGSSMTLENITGDIFDVYQWSTGENTPSIEISEPGIYWLVVEDFCDVNRINDTIFIKIFPSLEVDFGDDLLLCADSVQILKSPNCSSCSFLWNDGSQNDSLIVEENGLYWLEAENSDGCITADSIYIEFASCECHVYMPNSFTPNDDGKNDSFKPKFYCEFDNYSLEIYNRWGELIFKSTDPDISWDGQINNKPAQSGLYACVLKYTSLILNKKSEKVVKHQAITLIE